MSIPSWARKGARVVCVDFSPGGGGEPCPMKKGVVYTVAGVETVLGGLLLEEVEFHWYGRSLPFGIERFRPAVEPKQNEPSDVLERPLLGRQHFALIRAPVPSLRLPVAPAGP